MGGPVTTPRPFGINKIMPKTTLQVTTPNQLRLDLGIEVERTVAGIEMGVLQDGTPYLTRNGLARITGADRANISRLAAEWERTVDSGIIDAKTRVGWLREHLSGEYNDPSLFIVVQKSGVPHHAYPDVVCMAIIEYFAFEAQRTNPTAIKNYRDIARHGLRSFIYQALEYTPADEWRHFNDRVSLLREMESVPKGYFSIFKEISGMVVDMINQGLTVNDKTVPDISVGSHWGRHWIRNDLAQAHGERRRWDHCYPPYFPQATSNPQEAWAYPDAALPAFRQWFQDFYLPSKFPPYILKKAGVLKGGPDEARKIAGLYQKQIGPGPDRAST